MTLKELPKVKKLKVKFAGIDWIEELVEGNWFKRKTVFIEVMCPACKIDHICEIGRVFDCCRCNARIKSPLVVRVK